MKKYLILSALVWAIACEPKSADESSEKSTQATTQVWKLTSIAGSMGGVAKTGNAMDWQASLHLLSDQTFVKQRLRDGKSIEAKGTFAFTKADDGQYLVLTYYEQHELIGNCTGDLLEHYRMENNTTLIGSWAACDGPTLVFSRQ